MRGVRLQGPLSYRVVYLGSRGHADSGGLATAGSMTNYWSSLMVGGEDLELPAVLEPAERELALRTAREWFYQMGYI